MIDFLFISTSKYPTNAGAARSVFNYANYLSKQGFSCELVSYDYQNWSFQNETIDSLVQQRIPYLFKNKYLKKLNKVIIPYLIIKLLFSRNVFIVSTPVGYKSLLFTAYLLGKKSVLRSSSMGLDDITSLAFKYGRIFFRINKYFLSKASCYVALNKSFKQSYLNIFPNSSRVIQHTQGVDLSEFYPCKISKMLKKKSLLGTDCFVFLSVGHVVERKGIKDNMIALSKLSMPFLYIIVGDYIPDLDDSFHSLWAEQRKREMKGLKDFGENLLKQRILFTGRKDNVRDYYQAADVFLHTSYKEGFPNVVLEAMACGIPPIVRKLEDIYEDLVIDGYSGLIVDENHPLEEKIEYLLTNEKKIPEMGENCYNLISKNASYQSLTKSIFSNLKIDVKQS